MRGGNRKLIIVLLFVLVFCNAIVVMLIYTNYLRYSVDVSGRVGDNGNIELFVEGNDETAPSVSIVYPTNVTYTSHIDAINYTASDNFALSSCWYSLNLGITNTSISCGVNVTGITSSAGSNT